MIGPGNGAVGAPVVLFDLPNMLLNVWEVKEPRRLRLEPSLGGVVEVLSLDILTVVAGLEGIECKVEVEVEVVERFDQ